MADMATLAKSAAEQALVIDLTLSEAHSVLALITGSVEYDWKLAERHFQTAMSVDPVPALVRVRYALYFLTPLRRFEEALEQYKLALQTDPLSMIVHFGLGFALCSDRQMFRHGTIQSEKEDRQRSSVRSKTGYSGQEFRERSPIIALPSFGQVFRLSFRKTGMVEDNLGSRALLDEFKSRNRIDTRIPIDDAPGLNDSFVRCELDVPPDDMSCENCESASHLSADLRRRSAKRHTRLHRGTEVHDLVELGGLRERFVQALPARFESGFLMNGFGNV
jgi:tetratricopeptide (TPR) repeat protein